MVKNPGNFGDFFLTGSGDFTLLPALRMEHVTREIPSQTVGTKTSVLIGRFTLYVLVTAHIFGFSFSINLTNSGHHSGHMTGLKGWLTNRGQRGQKIEKDPVT